jgi:hypothetical protein
MSVRRQRGRFVALLLAGAYLQSCTSDGPAEDPARGPGIESVTLEEFAETVCVMVPSGPVPDPDCVRVVYVWSSSMPLSEVGIREIEKATDGMGMPLSVLRDAELLEPSEDPTAERLRGELVSAGATIHYPSLAVLADGGVSGSAIVGFKRAEVYRDLLEERIAALFRPEAAEQDVPAEPLPVPSAPIGHEPRILWSHRVSPAPGAFFRRVPGTSFISYDQRSRVYLHDVPSGEWFVGPGWIDFVPTPDGLLFVTPAWGNRGLEFYDTGEVFHQGLQVEGARYRPVFTDAEMSDQYPSAGILDEDEEAGTKRYRVLVSWYAGLAFRDYEVRWPASGSPDVAPVGPKRTACPNSDLSTPILSKDGREVAARDEATGTTKVFRLEDDGACEERFDLGRPTSKVGFSSDGSLIAFSSPDPPIPGRVSTSTTYVLDRGEMRTIPVPFSRSVGLVIPEMVGTDSLLISVRESAAADSAEFRLLCCVR